MSIGVQKKWPYKKAITEKLRRLQENGSLDHLASKYVKNAKTCSDSDSDSDLSLSIFKLVMPFVLFFSGMFLSMSILSFELIKQWISKK